MSKYMSRITIDIALKPNEFLSVVDNTDGCVYMFDHQGVKLAKGHPINNGDLVGKAATEAFNLIFGARFNCRIIHNLCVAVNLPFSDEYDLIKFVCTNGELGIKRVESGVSPDLIKEKYSPTCVIREWEYDFLHNIIDGQTEGGRQVWYVFNVSPTGCVPERIMEQDEFELPMKVPNGMSGCIISEVGDMTYQIISMGSINKADIVEHNVMNTAYPMVLLHKYNETKQMITELAESMAKIRKVGSSVSIV